MCIGNNNIIRPVNACDFLILYKYLRKFVELETGKIKMLIGIRTLPRVERWIAETRAYT